MRTSGSSASVSEKREQCPRIQPQPVPAPRQHSTLMSNADPRLSLRWSGSRGHANPSGSTSPSRTGSSPSRQCPPRSVFREPRVFQGYLGPALKVPEEPHMDPELISSPQSTCLGQGRQGPLEELKQTRESPVHRGAPLLHQRQSERLTHTRSRYKAVQSSSPFPWPLFQCFVPSAFLILHPP